MEPPGLDPPPGREAIDAKVRELPSPDHPTLNPGEGRHTTLDAFVAHTAT